MLMLVLFATTIAIGAGFTVVRRKRKGQAGTIN
jgi:hypothetical protein